MDEKIKILSVVSDAILAMDRTTNMIVYMNPACCKLLEYSLEDVACLQGEQVFGTMEYRRILRAKVLGDVCEFQNILVQGKIRKSSCSVKVWKNEEESDISYCMLKGLDGLISLDQFQSVVVAYPEPTFIVLMDEGLTVQFGNQAFYNMFEVDGNSFASIFENQFLLAMEANKRKEYWNLMHEQLQNLSGFCLDIRLYDGAGEMHYASFSGTTIPSAFGQKKLMYCRLHNTDEKHELIEALDNEKFFFQAVQSLSTDLLFRYRINEQVIDYFGEMREEMGLPLYHENYPACLIESDIVFAQDKELYVKQIERMQQGIEEVAFFRAHNKYGKTVWLKKEYRIYRDAMGNPVEVIGRVSNVQIQKELEERINVDTLTGCLRKSAFEMIVSSEMEHAPEGYHTVMIVDLDNFKAINDNLGHQFGDMVLAEVGEKLRSLFRISDYVGRIGGDEFMVFMRGINRKDTIIEKVNAVLQEMDRTYQGSLHSYRISASVGIASYPKDGATFKELYEHADIAMFDAKNRGKNAFVFYDESLSKGTMENTMPFDVASRALSQHFDAKVLSESFNLLFETKDLDISMNGVLQILGTRFGVSRVFVFENSKTEEGYYSNTYEWCNHGVKTAKPVAQKVPKEIFHMITKQGNAEGIVYCNDLGLLEDEVRIVLEEQEIQSFLHAYVYCGDEVLYAIGFDDCTEKRVWSPMEISTLLQSSKVVAQFLNYKNALEGVEYTSAERLSVLDSLNYFSYIIDVDTHELTYFNQYTSEMVPTMKLGDLCYRALRGKEEECEDCPLKEMRNEQKDSVRMVLYNTTLGKYILVNASKLPSFGGKKSVFVSAHDISDVSEIIENHEKE